MKKAKLKTKKVEKEKEIESTMSGKSVAITFISLIVIFVAFYFLTDFLISNKTATTSDSDSSSNETVSNISFSELLKQSEDEYYVFAIMEDDTESFYERYADAIGTTYYEIDMADPMNQSYVSDTTNIAEKVREIKISDTTLFVISDGKIIENYTGKENITTYLQTKLPINE